MPGPVDPGGPPKRRLGELLVEARCVTKEQLEGALLEQRKSGKRLGRILVERGVVSEARLIRALSIQSRIEVCEPIPPVHDRVLAMVPRAIIEEFGVVPIAARRDPSGDIVTLLTSDPTIVPTVQAEVQQQVGLRTQFLLAAESEILRLVARVLPGQPEPAVVKGEPVRPSMPPVMSVFNKVPSVPAGTPIPKVKSALEAFEATPAPPPPAARPRDSEPILLSAEIVSLPPEEDRAPPPRPSSPPRAPSRPPPAARAPSQPPARASSPPASPRVSSPPAPRRPSAAPRPRAPSFSLGNWADLVPGKADSWPAPAPPNEARVELSSPPKIEPHPAPEPRPAVDLPIPAPAEPARPASVPIEPIAPVTTSVPAPTGLLVPTTADLPDSNGGADGKAPRLAEAPPPRASLDAAPPAALGPSEPPASPEAAGDDDLPVIEELPEASEARAEVVSQPAAIEAAPMSDPPVAAPAEPPVAEAAEPPTEDVGALSAAAKEAPTSELEQSADAHLVIDVVEPVVGRPSHARLAAHTLRLADRFARGATIDADEQLWLMRMVVAVLRAEGLFDDGRLERAVASVLDLPRETRKSHPPSLNRPRDES